MTVLTGDFYVVVFLKVLNYNYSFLNTYLFVLSELNCVQKTHSLHIMYRVMWESHQLTRSPVIPKHRDTIVVFFKSPPKKAVLWRCFASKCHINHKKYSLYGWLYYTNKVSCRDLKQLVKIFMKLYVAAEMHSGLASIWRPVGYLWIISELKRLFRANYSFMKRV